MNDETMVISAFGFVDGTDYGGSLLDGAIRPLPPGPFDDLRWDAFSERPYKRYGRLDILSRYAAVAVELLGLAPLTESQSDMALVMGTEQGCLAVDLDFRNSMDQEGGGSPLLFMYTLHNACMGEIAIRYNITGPNLCLIAGEESGLSAIWEGLRLIRCGEAQSCVCLAADGLGLHFIIEDRARAVGVDVADVRRLKIGHGQCLANGGLQARTAFGWGCNMGGVVGAGPAFDTSQGLGGLMASAG